MKADTEAGKITWINPNYKLPGEKAVVVIVTGKCMNTHFIKALMIGFYVKDEGWIIDGWEHMTDFTVHAWADFEFPDLGE